MRAHTGTIGLQAGEHVSSCMVHLQNTGALWTLCVLLFIAIYAAAHKKAGRHGSETASA